VGAKFVFDQDHRMLGIAGGVHPFIGGPSGMRIQEVPRVNKNSTPITIFLPFFMEEIQLLVAETNKYYSKYLDIFDNDGGCS
jgi:hypothetical protein